MTFIIILIVAILFLKFYLPYSKGKKEMEIINRYVENIRKGNDRIYNLHMLGMHFRKLGNNSTAVTNKITLEQCGYLAEDQSSKNRNRANICFALSDKLGGEYSHLYDDEEIKELAFQVVDMCFEKVGFDQAIDALLNVVCSMDLSF